MCRFGLPVPFRTLVDVLADVARLGFIMLHSRAQLAAENLFLRKQLALYLERQVKPRRADDATRITLVALSRSVTERHYAHVVDADIIARARPIRLPSREGAAKGATQSATLAQGRRAS